jgi:Ca2+/Na+ antiporter
VATVVIGVDAAPALLAMVVVEALAATTKSTPTPPAATTVSASAKTHTHAGRGAMIGALIVEVTVVVGAIRTPDATALEETATVTMTVATDGTGETATSGAAIGSMAVSVGAVEEGAMAVLAADVIGGVSRRKTPRRLTSRAKLHQISLASPTS